MIFPDTYYPYPMGLPNFCYHLAIKEMAINDKIRLVSLVVYNYILPRKTGKCNNLPVRVKFCGKSRPEALPVRRGSGRRRRCG